MKVVRSWDNAELDVDAPSGREPGSWGFDDGADFLRRVLQLVVFEGSAGPWSMSLKAPSEDSDDRVLIIKCEKGEVRIGPFQMSLGGLQGMRSLGAPPQMH